MSKISDILQTAQRRAKEMDLPYEGALLPAEAYEIMQSAPDAKLVDVRTRAEIEWVGRIPEAVEVEWASFPGMQRNPNFVAELKQKVSPESVLMFICRSGHRSHAAAALATRSGFGDCYNVLEGFQGDPDGDKHRDTLNGWRKAGLPWEQG